MSKLEKLRGFVNAAHNYAACEYDCTITILQEYENGTRSSVVVGMYGSESDPEKDDPDTTQEIRYADDKLPPMYHNLKFCVWRSQEEGGPCLTNAPADLFRLMYA